MKRKKSTWRGLILAGMLALFPAVLAGCAEGKNQEVSLAMVAGCHSNAPGIPLGAKSIQNAIYNSCYTYGTVTFITADGCPSVYFQADVPEPEVSGLTESKKESIANGYVSQLMRELSLAEPKEGEVDTLKAILLASKALKGSGDGADKVLVVLDSGLSTTGYLDFTKGLLYAKPESVVEALQKAEAIPDLSGVKVVWMYLGQTAAPQRELSEKQKHRLQDIWYAVLCAGGASEVKFTADISSEAACSGYPGVSVVDVEDRQIGMVRIAQTPVEIVIEDTIDTIVLDNATLRFIGNKAEFVDPKEAAENLKEYAQVLLDHPDNKVYIIGTTASGGKDFCNQLSRDRADAVVEVLKGYGVPEHQMMPIGLGYEDPWHIEDIDGNGRLVEEYACRNRKVLIVDAAGNDAAALR